jgi:hypothetical protein
MADDAPENTDLSSGTRNYRRGSSHIARGFGDDIQFPGDVMYGSTDRGSVQTNETRGFSDGVR